MLNTTRTMTRLLSAVAAVFRFMTPTHSQGLPPNLPTKEQLVNRNNFFLSLARKALKWEEPAEPIKLVGHLYFIGTKGLGIFL